jgi:AcrR family transcriptional regulator
MKAVPETAPRKRPRQSRSQDLVARILHAADDLYSREGLQACNTNRIAQEAGISVGSLYQYFPTKESVFAELWRSQESQLARQVSSLPANDLADWLEALIAIFIEHKTFAHREHTGEIVDSAIRESFHAFATEVPSGLAPDIAGDLRAIIVALLDRETESLAGWQYTLTQRIRRALTGYLAIR